MAGLLFGATCSDWSVVEGSPREQWRAARRNARLRMKRCNLTLEQLAERADLHPLERAAFRLYAEMSFWMGGIQARINARAHFRALRVECARQLRGDL